MSHKNPKKNFEGYDDPSAYEAICKVEKETERFNRLFHMIRDLCDLAGFRILNRIVLEDKRTGKIWR